MAIKFDLWPQWFDIIPFFLTEIVKNFETLKYQEQFLSVAALNYKLEKFQYCFLFLFVLCFSNMLISENLSISSFLLQTLRETTAAPGITQWTILSRCINIRIFSLLSCSPFSSFWIHSDVLFPTSCNHIREAFLCEAAEGFGCWWEETSSRAEQKLLRLSQILACC